MEGWSMGHTACKVSEQLLAAAGSLSPYLGLFVERNCSAGITMDSVVVWGFAAVRYGVLGWKEPWSHLGTALPNSSWAGKTSVREAGLVPVPQVCTGQGFVPLFAALAAGTGEPGAVCMGAVGLFHYLLGLDPTTCISFSLFLLKEAKCSNLTLQFFIHAFIVVPGRAFSKVLQEPRSQFPC